MPYPTTPTLNPFNASDVPNLMANGPYDTVLTAIENYLAQLGAYVDAQVSAVRGEIPSPDDFATAAQLEQVSIDATAAQSAATSAVQTATAAQSAASTAQSAAATATANLANLIGTLNAIAVGDDMLISGIAADGTGTAISPAAISIQSEAASASTVAQEAMTDAETANAAIGTWSNSNTISTILGNMLNVAFPLPTQINEAGTGVDKSGFKLFNTIGGIGNAQNALGNVLASLMLAAPNGDHTKLLGYLDDNSENLANSPKVRSSAALVTSSGPSKGPSDAALTSSDLAAMKKTTDGYAYVG